MSNNAIRFSNYNRNDKFVVKSALADIINEQNFAQKEEEKENLQHLEAEDYLFAEVCGLAVELGADKDEIDALFFDFGCLDIYDIEASVSYWDGYYEGQPLADKLHSSEAFENISNTSRRFIGMALNELCDLPLHWVQHCVYARTRSVEVENPTISWRFTREEVEVA